MERIGQRLVKPNRDLGGHMQQWLAIFQALDDLLSGATAAATLIVILLRGGGAAPGDPDN
jgi:hypothetical protein